ncbi:MAG: histidine phosphotransferase family protein [Paracoccaceae bacterium]
MAVEQKSTDLAALIGSRICHDLISPIGAISNGLELLTMSGGPTGPEIDLITDSAGNAGARIGFFRVAFGAAAAQMMSRKEISAILSTMTVGTRLNVAWLPEEPQARREVRLAFLALLCCESALPYGGDITITNDGGWIIQGRAGNTSVDETVWAGLQSGSDPAEVTPATVQFALLPILAQEDGYDLGVTLAEGSVTIRF